MNDDVKHLIGNIICGFESLSTLPHEYITPVIAMNAITADVKNIKFVPIDLMDANFIDTLLERRLHLIEHVKDSPYIAQKHIDMVKDYSLKYNTVYLLSFIPTKFKTYDHMRWIIANFDIGHSTEMFNYDLFDSELANAMIKLNHKNIRLIPDDFVTLDMSIEFAAKSYGDMSTNHILRCVPHAHVDYIKTMLELIQ